MEAKSLMLGDYVHLKKYNCGQLIDTVVRIASINPLEGSVEPKSFNVEFENKNGRVLYIGARRFDISPVPLTAEILEKKWLCVEKGTLFAIGEL